MAFIIVNGNQQRISTFDGMDFADAVSDPRWDGMLQMLNVSDEAEPQVKRNRNFVTTDEGGDVKITANTQIRFVVGGGGKGYSA